MKQGRIGRGHRAIDPPATSENGDPAAGQRDRVMRTAIATANDYVSLTKPRIISLLLLTTVATMFVADPSGPALSVILWTMLGGYLAAGGAGAINHYIERERDARMERTSERPLASGRISPARGLAFGVALGLIAVVQLAITVNVLTAALAAAGLLGYVFVYTLWLKPRTPQNIVLGGAAGAVPPLVGWAAATGGLSAQALWPFAIVFFWTPPHFWALSLLIADDYARTGVPMLPVVRGEDDHPPPDPRLLGPAGGGHGRAGAHRALRRRSTSSPRWRSGPGSSRLALRPAGAAVAGGRPPPLPQLARLPGAALRRDGARPGVVTARPPGGRPPAGTPVLDRLPPWTAIAPGRPSGPGW